MGTAIRVDPYRAFNFRLEIDGLTAGSFSECSGLTAEGDAVDYREGTDVPLTVRKLVGLRKFTNIVLKRGYTQNGELWTCELPEGSYPWKPVVIGTLQMATAAKAHRA